MKAITHRKNSPAIKRMTTRYNPGGPQGGNPIKSGHHRKGAGRRTYKDSHRR